ncbi:Uma2 family endonuclease [Pedococcus soli]
MSMSYAEFLATETTHTEFFDGEATVNPPSRQHQRIIRRLARLLEDAAPEGYEVLSEAGWMMRPGFVFEPDIMVADKDAPGADLLRVAPLLVVEVASPSTKHVDLGRKTQLYAEGGLPWYWIVQPDNESITVLHNEDGRFVTVREYSRGVVTLDEPFVVTLDVEAVFSH